MFLTFLNRNCHLKLEYGRNTAEGRMLLLARSDRPHDNRKISYHLAHEMNGYAEWLAGDDDISMSVRTKGGNSGLRP